MLLRPLLPAIMLAFGPGTPVAEFRCDATRKVDVDGTWDAGRLARGQWHVQVEDDGTDATVSRCSFATSQGRVTCDRLSVDRIEVDSFIKAKKYYVFSAQYDIQIFADLRFIENNGRLSITFGTCRVTAP